MAAHAGVKRVAGPPPKTRASSNGRSYLTTFRPIFEQDVMGNPGEWFEIHSWDSPTGAHHCRRQLIAQSEAAVKGGRPQDAPIPPGPEFELEARVMTEADGGGSKLYASMLKSDDGTADDDWETPIGDS